MTDYNPPLDDTHTACLDARYEIRYMIAAALSYVYEWQPQPCPDRKKYR